MAGLELLYDRVANSIASAHDAMVCFVHWEVVQKGYKCLGIGDEPRSGEKKSEFLPRAWNTNKDLYTLRYRSNDDKSNLLLKAITVDSSLIFNLMDSATDKVTDLTIDVSHYVNETNLQSFESVYKNKKDLVKKLNSSLLTASKERSARTGRRERPVDTWPDSEDDPLRIPHRGPSAAHPSNWIDPVAPFAGGGADLDPLGRRPGGMIVDPLHSGFPRPGFNPTTGIPGVLPPGSVPPGARFDPFGPTGRPGLVADYKGYTIWSHLKMLFGEFDYTCFLGNCMDVYTPKAIKKAYEFYFEVILATKTNLGHRAMCAVNMEAWIRGWKSVPFAFPTIWPDPDHLTPPGYDDMFM